MPRRRLQGARALLHYRGALHGLPCVPQGVPGELYHGKGERGSRDRSREVHQVRRLPWRMQIRGDIEM